MRDVLAAEARPLEPLQGHWLASDVVAVARGIAATGDLAGLPALTDALVEAGCEEPFQMKHLRRAPTTRRAAGWWK